MNNLYLEPRNPTNEKDTLPVAIVDRLFTLVFVPHDPDAGSAYSEMDTLYELVMDTLDFISK